MARGKRSHPTESLGVLPEKNTIHAFGPQGHETYGWPYRATSVIGTPVGPGRLYRAPRLSQNPLGSSRRSRRRSRKRRRR